MVGSVFYRNPFLWKNWPKKFGAALIAELPVEDEVSLPKFSIASLSCAPNLVLAPMSGVTNSCFRRFIKRLNPGHVGLVVTEFISVEGMTRQNAQSLRMMSFQEEERPISVQIFGFDIDRMVAAAEMVQAHGADIVDINCGCPVPKVVRRGGGCELMRQSNHLEKMLQALRKAVSIPLTLKIRAGWDESSRNAVEIARMAEGCGIDMLAVHGRTRQALYRGEADWSIVRDVCAAVKIPVVGSGDVVNFATAVERYRSGVAALMIGRGALSNPWVFSEISLGLQSKEFVRPPASATADVLQQYAEILSADLPEKAVIGRLKQFSSQVTRRVHGSADVRRALCRSQSVAEFCDLVATWKEHLLKLGDDPQARQFAFEQEGEQSTGALG